MTTLDPNSNNRCPRCNGTPLQCACFDEHYDRCSDEESDHTEHFEDDGAYADDDKEEDI